MTRTEVTLMTPLIILCIFTAVFLAYAAPDTPLGKICRDRLVTRPSRWIKDFPHVVGILALGTILLVICTTWLMGRDGFAASLQMAPDFLTFASSFEVSSFIEAASSLAFVMLTTGVGRNILILRAVFRRTARRSRRIARVTCSRLTGATSEDPDPAGYPAFS